MRIKIIRISVVIGALSVCYFLLLNIPHAIETVTSAILGKNTIEIPYWGALFLSILFCYYLLTVIFPFFLTIGWVLCSRKIREAGNAVPFISIIIPAFNEEKSILRSLEALNKIDYPSFEVIVVNDGSTDFTFSVIESSYVKCIHLRTNQGKAVALNAGIAAASGQIIVFSDSDSWLHPMSLRFLVQGFSDSNTGAVSGTVEIEPQNGLLRHWQVLEYTFGQFFVKEAQLGSGSSVAICPGPVCAYRKELLMQIGGFSSRTITEDFDATLQIIQAGYSVNYAPKAIAYTEAPSTFVELRRQRLRWFRGHIQTFRLHRSLFFSSEIGSLGIYWLPLYYLFFGYICGALELAIIPILLILFFTSSNLTAMLVMTCFYNLFALFIVSMGYCFVLVYSNRFSWSLLGSAFLSYPYLLYLNWLRLCAIYNETRGKIVTWSG